MTAVFQDKTAQMGQDHVPVAKGVADLIEQFFETGMNPSVFLDNIEKQEKILGDDHIAGGLQQIRPQGIGFYARFGIQCFHKACTMVDHKNVRYSRPGCQIPGNSPRQGRRQQGARESYWPPCGGSGRASGWSIPIRCHTSSSP